MRCSALLLSALVCCSPTTQDPKPTGRPVDVYRELDGVWEGTFVGYDTTGVELYRIAVRQEYETVDARTQRVKVRDTMPDGTVITGEGENTATRQSDGTTELRCVVRKSNGERAEHAGRIVRGPDGTEQLVWYSSAEDRVETFREWVESHGKDAVYHIQGTGRYGDQLMMMAGRYARVD